MSFAFSISNGVNKLYNQCFIQENAKHIFLISFLFNKDKLIFTSFSLFLSP